MTKRKKINQHGFLARKKFHAHVLASRRRKGRKTLAASFPIL